MIKFRDKLKPRKNGKTPMSQVLIPDYKADNVPEIALAPLALSGGDKKIHESHVADIHTQHKSKISTSQKILHSNTSTILEIENSRWGKHVLKVFDHSSMCMGYRELTIMTTCKHPNIQRVLYAYHLNSRLHIGMPHGGISTVDYITKNGPLAHEMAEKWLLNAAKAVQYLHCNDLVHGDIKPSNFVVSENGDPSSLTLIDFELTGHHQRYDMAVTLPHRAPEILLGRPWGKPADIWALATTFFYWITGQHFMNHPRCAIDDSIGKQFALDAARRWACYGAFKDLPLWSLPEEDQVNYFEVIWPIEKKYTMMLTMLRYYPERRMDIDQVVETLSDSKEDTRVQKGHSRDKFVGVVKRFFASTKENAVIINKIAMIRYNTYAPYFNIPIGMCKALCTINTSEIASSPFAR